jgi:hypothetical protein
VIATLVLTAAVLGSCPKPLPVPLHHKRHKAVPALQCTCVDEPPRTIWLTPPEPDIEPIPLSVYPYYISMAWDNSPDEPNYAGNYWVDDYAPIGGYAPGKLAVRAPEIDASSSGAALTLLCGMLAVLRGGRRV